VVLEAEAESEDACWVGFRRRVEWERRVGRQKVKRVGLRSSGEGGGGTRDASMRFLSTNIFLVRVCWLISVEVHTMIQISESTAFVTKRLLHRLNQL
jgi:hypothetical protein